MRLNLRARWTLACLLSFGGASAAHATTVLFVGNSLMSTQTTSTGEEMHRVLGDMAASRAKTLEASVVFDPGHTLQDSWNANLPQPYLTGSAHYDYIVLQDFSTLPVQNEALFDQTALVTYQPSVQRSLALSGKVLLFENWALVDPSPYATRAQDVSALDAAYAKLSSQLTVANQIVPIAHAWETVLATRPTSFLFNADGKHPVDASIYLNAAVFYAVIFHDTPVGLPALYLSAADAALLQNAAAQVVETSLPPLDAGVPAPDAGSATSADPGSPADADAGFAATSGVDAVPMAATSGAGGCSSARSFPAALALLGTFVLIARRRGFRRAASPRCRATGRSG